MVISLDPEDTGTVYPGEELMETLQACTGLVRESLTRPVPIGTLVQPLGDDNERRVDYYASLVEHADPDSASDIDSRLLVHRFNGVKGSYMTRFFERDRVLGAAAVGYLRDSLQEPFQHFRQQVLSEEI